MIHLKLVIYFHKCRSIVIVKSLTQIHFKNQFNPVALRKTKIAYNFGLSECSRVKDVVTSNRATDRVWLRR